MENYGYFWTLLAWLYGNWVGYWLSAVTPGISLFLRSDTWDISVSPPGESRGVYNARQVSLEDTGDTVVTDRCTQGGSTRVDVHHHIPPCTTMYHHVHLPYSPCTTQCGLCTVPERCPEWQLLGNDRIREQVIWRNWETGHEKWHG